jgi:hypothetical protein
MERRQGDRRTAERRVQNMWVAVDRRLGRDRRGSLDRRASADRRAVPDRRVPP